MSIIEKAMNKLAKQDEKKISTSKLIKSQVEALKKRKSDTGANIKDANLRAKQRLIKAAAKSLDFGIAQKLREAGILPVEEQILRNDDEFRRIKRPLLANAFGKGVTTVENGCLIMLTSSLPDEGKTHNVINLAMSMAKERDNSVLLLDADVAKADVSRIFEVYDNPGLTELLCDDDVEISDVIVDTEIPNLSVLPAGSRHSDTTELLASDKMSALLKELAQQPDRIVLIDSPPLLVTPEPQVLATLVGQIVLVVEAVKTPKHIVATAIELLDTDKPLNLVLNKGNRSLDIGYYGAYHYAYNRPQE